MTELLLKRVLSCFSQLSISLVCVLFLTAPSEAVSLTNLEMIGRYAELEKAAEQKLAAEPKPTASVLGPLCMAYSRVKRYTRLLDCLDRLEKQIEAGDTVLETDKALISNSDGTAMPKMLRAEAYLELGNYKAAIEEGKKALAAVQDRKSAGLWSPKRYRLSIMGTLGIAYALSGDRANAAEQIRQLEDFSIGFMGHAFYRPYRTNAVARIYMALGEFARAFEYVKDDDNLWYKAVWFLNDAAWGYSGGDGVEIHVTLPKMFIRAKCLLETGQLGEAKKTLDAILRHGRISDNGELYWITLFERGRLAGKQQAYDEAEGFYLRAVAVVEQQRATIHSEVNKIGFVGDKQALYGQLIGLLVRLQKPAEAFDYVERSKSRALVDMLSSKKDFAIKGPDPEKVRRLLGELTAADIGSHVLGEAGPDGTPSLRSMTKTVSDIRSVDRDLSSLVSVSALQLSEIRALLGESESLVEYYYHGADLYAFVIDKLRIQAVRLDAAGLEEKIRTFRRQIEDSKTADWEGTARAVYDQLWLPLDSLVPGRRLLIVGHGALHYLSFPALMSPDRRLLLDRFSMRFLPSASVLAYLRSSSAAKGAGLVAFGNPDLGSISLRLRFAEREAREIAALHGDSRLLLGEAASETNFRQAAGHFFRIHFATHGEFSAESPLDSRLYLAADQANDGLLTVGELYTMDLDADLVTLSACETGIGKIASGDDVVGLTRGFLYAGSRSVLASLWSVDDRATAVLMKSFYENLRSMDKSDALRQAQIAARSQNPHPFYWAAFQLTGRVEQP